MTNKPKSILSVILSVLLAASLLSVSVSALLQSYRQALTEDVSVSNDTFAENSTNGENKVSFSSNQENTNLQPSSDTAPPLQNNTQEDNSADIFQGNSFDSGVFSSDAATDLASAVLYPEQNITYTAASNTDTVKISFNPLDARAFSLNASHNNFLIDETDTCLYRIQVDKRGVFHFGIKHPNSETLGSWHITLYGEYYKNGTSGEKAYRILHIMDTTVGLIQDESVSIGLYKGTYYLYIQSGTVFDASAFTLYNTFEETADYEIECNDTIYKYTQIYSGKPVKGSASVLPGGVDEDWFMLTVPSFSTLRLNFTHKEEQKTSVCWKITLYDENQNILWSNTSLCSDALTESTPIGLTQGYYYILVQSRVQMPFDYTLTVARTIANNYETEYNDTPLTACLLPPDTQIGGNLGAKSDTGDTDYYKLIITENGYMDFCIQTQDAQSRNYNFRVTVSDENGNILYKTLLYANGETTAFPSIGFKKGNYYVKIDEDNLYVNEYSYTLSYRFYKTNHFEQEYNGNAQNATPLTELIQTDAVITDCTDFDEDWFMLEATAPIRISLVFTHEKGVESNELYTVTAYKADLTPISPETASGYRYVTEQGEPITQTSIYQNEQETEMYFTLSPGVSYIKVTSGLFNSTEKYSLVYSQITD